MFNFYDNAENLAVVDALAKSSMVIPRYSNVAVSISGGSDSDIVLDMVEKTKGDAHVEYVWFDTGLEYQATKDHLKYLEQKYGIQINRYKAVKPIPTCVKQYGVPFLSKMVSQRLYTLQQQNFKFEDKSLEVLKEEYPNLSVTALKWWCDVDGGVQQYRISYNKWLKEFLIENPPTFKIANKCCEYAKKKVAKNFNKDFRIDLSVIGVRRAEGGIRATAYKSCYSEEHDDKIANFRPIFWLSDEDKKDYERQFGICHSACYTKYGLKRTGCVGCPYGRNVLDELEAVEKYEPKIYKACMNIFGESYEYTKKYRQFCLERNYQAKQNPDQLTFNDMFFDFAIS